ncbi:APC family permease [Gulosibacter molinativorax]|uniref:APC family permease n=1 Tax=Gulosibacter molinativorax TaxID=256821 RepID=A0ABT7C700_9MICO|nr:APC family permease [Gulosibacter molinativorax]MDJ1370888.1 APC family permease [Gulosibacter molinativorax]QUY62225.1 Amino acid permease family protein [Gulosibacter molinativorax]
MSAPQNVTDTGHIHVGKGLNSNALGVVGSTVIGLASTAPLYSLAATLGYVILAIGAQAPVAFLAAAIPMVFAALAYQELNREMPDCGTTFVWGTKAFGPVVGWIGGWAVAVSAVMVLANVSEIAGKYLWYLVGRNDLADNRVVVVITGCVFIAVMTFISTIGVQIGEKLQMVLMVIQYIALAAFGILAFAGAINGSSPSAVPFDIEWFNPAAVESWSGFIEAVLLCLFIYWGWDTCLALNEETKNPRKTPGRAALATIVILIVTYVGISVAVMMYAGFGTTGFGLTNEANLDDVFTVLRDALFGPWGWFLILAMLVSGASSTQTTILPTARGTLSMAVYRALPAKFASIHPKWKTPWFSTTVMGISAIVYYAVMSLISENVLADSLTSMGLAVALYYAITAFACVWYYRDTLFTTTRNFFMRGLLPFLGGVMLTYAFVQSAIDMISTDYSMTVLLGIGGAFVIGVGALALGFVLMGIWWMFPNSKPFFRGESLNRETPVLVPDEG